MIYSNQQSYLYLDADSPEDVLIKLDVMLHKHLPFLAVFLFIGPSLALTVHSLTPKDKDHEIKNLT